MLALDSNNRTKSIPASKSLLLHAVHKLIVYGERPVSDKVKANKDLGQAAAIFKVLFDNGNVDLIRIAWSDAASRGPGWLRRLNQGKEALLKRYPELLEIAHD